MPDESRILVAAAGLASAFAIIIFTVMGSIPLLADIDNIWVSLGYGFFLLGCLLVYSFAGAGVWDAVNGESHSDDADDEL